MESPSVHGEAFAQVVNEMTASVSSVHEVIRTVLDKYHADPDSSDHKDGISLLSLKNHVLIHYLHSLALLSAQRVLGHTLNDRSPPKESFASTSRSPRGPDAGDLVDSLVESRAVLEKTKALEIRMRYQIDKLVRLAQEGPSAGAQNVMDDPLAFRPNPQNFIAPQAEEKEHSDGDKVEDRRGVYRPPRVAPMPYTEAPTRRKDSKHREGPIPMALASLTQLDPSTPHLESSTGLGAMPSMKSSRARELDEMREFEESNMTRLVMKKKDQLRRLRDEEDIALGGMGGTFSGDKRRGRMSGMESEFADVLKGIARSKRSTHGDGYDELRARGRKESALDRSRSRKRPATSGEMSGSEGRKRKQSRFEKEVKASKKKIKNRR